MGDSISVEEATQVCQTAYDLNKGQKSVILTVGVNASKVHMHPGVNEEFTNNPLFNEIRHSQAFVFSSLPQRLLIGLYMRLNKNRNIKTFATEKEAKAWVLQQQRTLEAR
jgi:hypothetical protein